MTNPAHVLVWFLAASVGTVAVAWAAPSSDTTPTQRGMSPPPPPPPRSATPFRLGMTYTRVLSEDGDLSSNNLATNALGLDLVSPSSSYVRNHLGLAHQWESNGAYSARGFRIDLVSLGYPIRLLTTSEVHVDLEPILTVIRGEIMFVNGGGRFLRMESGFGLELSATFRGWFLCVQPLAIDFRYWVYRSAEPQSLTGLGRIFPLRVAIGHEF